MTSPHTPASIVVVSDHAADFVCRAGGAIALFVERTVSVDILCPTYGERGESHGCGSRTA